MKHKNWRFTNLNRKFGARANQQNPRANQKYPRTNQQRSKQISF